MDYTILSDNEEIFWKQKAIDGKKYTIALLHILKRKANLIIRFEHKIKALLS